jgi:AraC family transcriptional regulator of adaptative response / methylphosphotriester-DNA alkyltransferase methyltransferase
MKTSQFNSLYTKLKQRELILSHSVYYGVKTTGIFCLMHCPSKTPLAKNVEFFDSVSIALENGYRPCKRCKPDKSKNLAVNDAHEDIISLIHFLVQTEGILTIKELSKAVSISDRQLNRIIKKRFGVSTSSYIKSLV